MDTGNGIDELLLKSSFGEDIIYEKSRTKKSGYNIGNDDWLWSNDVLVLDNDYKISNIQVSIPKQKLFDKLENLQSADGLVGLPFLKRFDIVILDYKNNKLYLKVR